MEYASILALSDRLNLISYILNFYSESSEQHKLWQGELEHVASQHDVKDRVHIYTYMAFEAIRHGNYVDSRTQYLSKGEEIADSDLLKAYIKAVQGNSFFAELQACLDKPLLNDEKQALLHNAISEFKAAMQYIFSDADIKDENKLYSKIASLIIELFAGKQQQKGIIYRLVELALKEVNDLPKEHYLNIASDCIQHLKKYLAQLTQLNISSVGDDNLSLSTVQQWLAG